MTIRRVRAPEPESPLPPTQIVQSLVEARREGEVRRARAAVEWAAQIRRFARAAVWALPVAAITLGLNGWFGWPPAGGFEALRWLVLALGALAAGLVGVIGLTGLLITTRGRRWALLALLGTIAGAITLGPVVGLVVVADRTALAGDWARYLGLAGVALVVFGWLALGAAVLASDVLNGSDGGLLIAGAGVAALAVLVGQSFLQVIAAMLLLAAGLGIGWTSSRLTADGQPGPD
jgi:Amt family ammonium transporter